MRFPINGNCPKCGRIVKLISVEPHPNRSDLAYKNYECVTCGPVRSESVSLRPPRRRGASEQIETSSDFPDAGHGARSQEATMAQTYQGKPVTTVRDARDGDAGFDANKDQVVIKLEDGSEKTVPRSDVKGQ